MSAKVPFRPFTGLVTAIENAAAGVIKGGANVVADIVAFIPAADRPAVESGVKEAEIVLAEVDAALVAQPAAPVAPVEPATVPVAPAS